MAEIRLQYRWVPSALEPLPSLTHEGPWCRDAVPTGYKLEQRSFTAVVQMGFSLGQWQRHPETKRRIMAAGSGATFLDEGPLDATQSLWQVRASDFQGMGKSSAMGQEPTHTIRHLARCRPIAVSFHGLLPSRARFRFAGYVHGIRSNPFSSSSCFRLSMPRPENSHTERSPLDPAHISRRLAAMPKSAALGQ
jgi:hypothetical protein